MNTTPQLPARTDDLLSGFDAWAGADLDEDWAAFVADAVALAQADPEFAGGLVALSH